MAGSASLRKFVAAMHLGQCFTSHASIARCAFDSLRIWQCVARLTSQPGITQPAEALRPAWPSSKLTPTSSHGRRSGVASGLRTPLYDWHVAHGAKMVDFAGWDMPI